MKLIVLVGLGWLVAEVAALLWLLDSTSGGGVDAPKDRAGGLALAFGGGLALFLMVCARHQDAKAVDR